MANDLDAQRCPRCNIYKTLESYCPSRQGRLGCWCNDCDADRCRRDYHADLAGSRAYWRVYRQMIRALNRAARQLETHA